MSEEMFLIWFFRIIYILFFIAILQKLKENETRSGEWKN